MDYEDPSNLTENSTAAIQNAVKASEELKIFAALVIIVIIIVGVSGNVLTILALIKCPKIRNAAAAFIVSLCIADLLFCLVAMPFSVHRFLFGLSETTHDDALCVLVPFMQYANVGVSLLSVALITINRYIMVAHQNLYKKIYTKTTIGAMIAFSWFFSYGILVPTAFNKWGKFGFSKLLDSCTIVRDHKGKSPKSALLILGFLIPCIAIVVCYARIFWVVRSSESRLRKHNSESSTCGGGSGGNFRKGSEWRLTKMVLVIFLCFLVCFLPFTIIKELDKKVNYPDAHTLSYVLIYLSTCTNPIIYVIMNRQYRRAYKSVVCCTRLDLATFSGNHSNAERTININSVQSRTVISKVPLGPSCSV